MTPEAFFDPVHQTVFHTIQSLTERSLATDPPAVAAELQRLGFLDVIGGPATLLRLQEQCYTRDLASVDGWADRILDAWSKRRLEQAAAEIVEIAHSGTEAEDALESAERLVTTISSPGADQAVPLLTLLEDQADRIDRIQSGTVESGYSTGLKAIDDIIGGLVDQRMYVIAARPGMGKTSLAHTIGLHVAKTHQRPVLLASLEMRQDEVTDRFVAGYARISHTRLTEATLDEDEQQRYVQAVADLAEVPIEVLDDVSLTIPTIRAAARRMRSKYGSIGAVIIDYLSLLTPHTRASNRQEEVALISRSVKVMARQLDCPVIVLAQLNRKVEDRVDKRPILSDLRESGQVEQDCDVALMLYREDHYNPLSELRGVCEVIVAKNRHGKTGLGMVAWAGTSMSFFDLPDHVLNSLPSTRPGPGPGPGSSAPPSGPVDEF